MSSNVAAAGEGLAISVCNSCSALSESERAIGTLRPTVRATDSMLLTINNAAAKGAKSRYLATPICLVLLLFIILILFLSGKTLKLLATSQWFG